MQIDFLNEYLNMVKTTAGSEFLEGLGNFKDFNTFGNFENITEKMKSFGNLSNLGNLISEEFEEPSESQRKISMSFIDLVGSKTSQRVNADSNKPEGVGTAVFGIDQKGQGNFAIVSGFENESFTEGPAIFGALNKATLFDLVAGLGNTIDQTKMLSGFNIIGGFGNKSRSIKNDDSDDSIYNNNINGWGNETSGIFQNVNGASNITIDGIYNNIEGLNNITAGSMYSNVNGVMNAIFNSRNALKVKEVSTNSDDSHFVDVIVQDEIPDEFEVNCAVEIFVPGFLGFQEGMLTGQVSNIDKTTSKITLKPNFNSVWFVRSKFYKYSDFRVNESYQLQAEMFGANTDFRIRVIQDKEGNYCSSDYSKSADRSVFDNPFVYVRDHNLFNTVTGIKNIADGANFNNISGVVNSVKKSDFVEMTGIFNTLEQADRESAIFGKTRISGVANNITGSLYNVQGSFNKTAVDVSAFQSPDSAFVESIINGVYNIAIGQSNGGQIKGSVNTIDTSTENNAFFTIQDFIIEDSRNDGEEDVCCFIINRTSEIKENDLLNLKMLYMEFGSLIRLNIKVDRIENAEINGKEVTKIIPKENSKYKSFEQWRPLFQIGFFGFDIIKNFSTNFNSIIGFMNSIIGSSTLTEISGKNNRLIDSTNSKMNGFMNACTLQNSAVSGTNNNILGKNISIAGSGNTLINSSEYSAIHFKSSDLTISSMGGSKLALEIKLSKDIPLDFLQKNSIVNIYSYSYVGFNDRAYGTIAVCQILDEPDTSNDDYNVIKTSMFMFDQLGSTEYVLVARNPFEVPRDDSHPELHKEREHYPNLIESSSDITGDNNKLTGWSNFATGHQNSLTGLNNTTVGFNNVAFTTQSNILGSQNIIDTEVIDFVSFVNDDAIKIKKDSVSDSLNVGEIIRLHLRGKNATTSFALNITKIEEDSNDSTCYRVTVEGALTGIHADSKNHYLATARIMLETYDDFEVQCTKAEFALKRDYDYVTNVTIVGNQNYIKQDNSLVFGEHLNLVNQNFSLGYYNIDSADNLFEIGLGSKNLRQNGLEIKKTGNISAPMSDVETVTNKDLTTLEYLLSPEFGKKLPTEDPVVEGKLWNDNGTLKISAG